MEDVADVAELERSIFTDPWSERSIRESLEQTHTLLLAAYEDRELAGYLILYLMLEEAEIARIAVSEAFRRQGVATRIFRELESLCEDGGISKVLLEVRESNTAARTFYEGCGFVTDGIRKNYYSDPTEHAVLMSYEIGN